MTRWGQGRSQLHWSVVGLDRESLTTFRIPVQAVFLEMGDPGQCHFDSTRWVNCDGGIFLVRSGQWDLHAVFLRRQGFGWANTGASQKYPSGNDTSAVNLGSGAAQCKTFQEQRAKLL